MPKLIRINGKLARKNGKLVLDTNGAPCCCEEPPPQGCFDLNPPERGHMATVYLREPTTGTCNRPMCRLPECFEFRLKIRANRFYEYRQCLSNSTPCFQAFEERKSVGGVEVDLVAQCAWSVDHPGPGWDLVYIDTSPEGSHSASVCVADAKLYAKVQTFRVRFFSADTPGVPNLSDYDIESTDLDLLKVNLYDLDFDGLQYRFLWFRQLQTEADIWSATLLEWADRLGVPSADYQFNVSGDAQFTFVDDGEDCTFVEEIPPDYQLVGGIAQHMAGGWSCCQYHMTEDYEEWSNCRDYWGVDGGRQGAECIYPESPLYHWDLSMTSRIMPGVIGDCGTCLEEDGCSECVQTGGAEQGVGNRPADSSGLPAAPRTSPAPVDWTQPCGCEGGQG